MYKANEVKCLCRVLIQVLASSIKDNKRKGRKFVIYTLFLCKRTKAKNNIWIIVPSFEFVLKNVIL
jgi:hypothetical protein